ncbi:methyltransferase [Aeromonas simiae]|uniref:Methyltransferase n=1 Tax=Aeromonas simiae TaxID=218936 RepID=A0A5J6WUP0_9GAMM|nr:methyltransferase [Aeromonas simiae]QFI54849.1 methyltransferase [Aeromonas simiae]
MPFVLSERFSRLDALLTATTHWWQIQPYHHTALADAIADPALAQALTGLNDAQVQALEADGEARQRWLAPWIPPARELHALSQLAPLDGVPVQASAFLARDIPGRKWAQILAFSAALPAHAGPWLEWCAGKGHLGRLVALTRGAAVTSLEWQSALCEEGRTLALRDGACQHFVHGDAFSPEAMALIEADQHALALHACGDLHTTLIERVVAGQARGVTLSPCCYHLIRGDHYQPLSRAGQQSTLRLGKGELRLPLQETVTAGARVSRLREQEVVWRLAFDSLQRAVRGVDRYLAVPNVQKSLLGEGFTAFCRWAAERRDLTLPEVIDEGYWLAKGRERAAWVRRLELVQSLFRRPLELWLVLDRALRLEEAGYVVEVGEFCARPLTPRNILIRAVRG